MKRPEAEERRQCLRDERLDAACQLGKIPGHLAGQAGGFGEALMLAVLER